jgi:preprotein translocase subunit YajC
MYAHPESLNDARHRRSKTMQTTTIPTTVLGRHTRVQTSGGTIHGTILAVGTEAISIAVDRQVVRIPPGDIRAINAVC